MLFSAGRARESGALPGPSLARQACGDSGLALRLTTISSLTLDDRGGAQALVWEGDVLAVGYDDGRMAIWRPTEAHHNDFDTVQTLGHLSVFAVCMSLVWCKNNNIALEDCLWLVCPSC